MGELLSYSISGGILMLAMYIAYRHFLARDNQHSFNRAVLLTIYFVSFTAIPVFFHFETLSSNISAQPLIDNAEIAGVPVAALSKPIWGTVLIWIYLVGMIIVAGKTAITWLRLTEVIRSGQKSKHGRYTLVVTYNDKLAPFSWMHYVVISSKDFDNNYSAIVTHELKHVDSRHWIDLLIAQVVCIINWFNPVSWLMRDDLMLVHEYQADMAVIDSGQDPQAYQLLLIKKAVGSRFPSLANSLNHSKLKKRITMMYKEKSGARCKLKVLALVPMIALVLTVAAVPAVRAAVSTISNSDVSVSKSSENLPKDKMLAGRLAGCFKVSNITDDGKETTITIKGEGFGNNLTVTDVKLGKDYKSVSSTSLKSEKINGTASISATFPVTGDTKGSSLSLTINNEELVFVLGDAPDNTVSMDDVKYILDGKEISVSELKQIAPDKINSIKIDKSDKMNVTIIVTTKK